MCRKSIIVSASLIVFVLVCRLVPHLANFSPMVCVSLFIGCYLNKRMALVTIVGSMLASDLLLGLFYHDPFFGSWMWFTYSALLAVWGLGLLTARYSTAASISVITLLTSTLGFWVWTNFGVWLTSGMYSANMVGLMDCYVAAIPFLQTSLIGMCIWGGLYLTISSILRVNISQPQSQSY